EVAEVRVELVAVLLHVDLARRRERRFDGRRGAERAVFPGGEARRELGLHRVEIEVADGRDDRVPRDEEIAVMRDKIRPRQRRELVASALVAPCERMPSVDLAPQAKAAREARVVVLGGDGGDEL